MFIRVRSSHQLHKKGMSDVEPREGGGVLGRVAYQTLSCFSTRLEADEGRVHTMPEEFENGGYALITPERCSSHDSFESERVALA